MKMTQCLVSVTLLLLVACQSHQAALPVVKEVLYDDGFVDFAQIPIETQKEIFQLDPEAKAFARRSIKGVLEAKEQIPALVKQIFERSDFNLLYRAEANTTANQTFKNRAANCLSLSIMTYALAKELGFGVRFQDIAIPEYWTMREGHSLLNRHINLQILPRPNSEQRRFVTQGFEVDFDAQATRPHFPKTLLKTHQIVAMFYNNKGADALLVNNHLAAYAYFRAALGQAPKLPSALANLGYLYRLAGYHQQAENAYYTALSYDQENLTAWRNLAYLYRHTGRDARADEIAKRVAHKRSANPFFHVNLGDKAFEQQQWQQALTHYQRALKLNKSYHEVFFGLAKAHYALGNVARSQHYLKLAKKKSRTQAEQSKYQSKLDFIKGLSSHKSRSGLYHPS
jgi:tetratricopeptide (TPR) repeat protein